MFVKPISVVCVALFIVQLSMGCPCPCQPAPLTIPLPLPPVIPIGRMCTCKTVQIKPSLTPAKPLGCAPPPSLPLGALGSLGALNQLNALGLLGLPPMNPMGLGALPYGALPPLSQYGALPPPPPPTCGGALPPTLLPPALGQLGGLCS